MTEHKHGEMRLSKLYYKGKWVLRTTETGVEINGKVAWYRIVWAYTKYLWIKIVTWFGNGPGPTDAHV